MYCLYELRETAAKSKMYEESRNEMLAGISHDLRTPLISIKSYIKGIKDGVASTKEKQENYLSIIYNKATPISMFIKNITELSRSIPLSPIYAILLVATSVLLSMLGGLIPSKLAAQKIPVLALRS